MATGQYTAADLAPQQGQTGQYSMADIAGHAGAASPQKPFSGGVPSGMAQPNVDMGYDWYGFTPSNIALNVGRGAAGAVKGMYGLGKDIVSNPNWFTGPTSTWQKFVAGPGEAEHQKANELYQQGRKWESFGHGLAGDIPLVGPWAASLGEQTGEGDIGGAVGQVGGAYLGAKVAKGAAQTATAIPIGAASALMKLPNAIMDAKALQKGFDVTGKMVKIVDRGDNLSQAARGVLQGKITPNLGAAVEKVGIAKDAAWKALTDTSNAVNGDSDVALTPVVERNRTFLAKHEGVSREAEDYYKQQIGNRTMPLSIEALNRIKSGLWAKSEGANTPGVDALYYKEIYHGINDALKAHADGIGAREIYDDAMEHSRVYYAMNKGVISQLLENPNPVEGEHITQLNKLLDKQETVWKSVRDKLTKYKDTYDFGNLDEQLSRHIDYVKELYKGMDNYARGFQGLFKSAADHPVASIFAYEMLRRTPWLVRLFGVAKVAKMLNELEAGHALRQVRGEITDPQAYLERLPAGTKPKTYNIQGPNVPPAPSGPEQPPPPRAGMGPVTPEEQAQWGGPIKGEVVPKEGAPSSREQTVSNYINKLFEHRARNEAVRGRVEDLSESGTDPKQVMGEFWDKTFPALDEKGKANFLRQFKAQIGLQPGDTIVVEKGGNAVKANDWRDITDRFFSGAKTVDNLEQNEQAITGLADILNEMRRKGEGPEPSPKQQLASKAADVRGGQQSYLSSDVFSREDKARLLKETRSRKK